ncbi:putative ethanolamine-phosphate cytidylyltransferase [Babesia bovis T2Bo]|uniref:ethanolamine-phosphate cytidylyltransferase n=1 Tax=Babesia bovis TaxID=5865 RepID=A7AWT3_BABBO|nr:putative ethanolamine-phosphate cytidylyltransferase [Babesia bovis T2Bo]EDO05511.1 putative ethanolamine-phosphate cytidylyltransferase [Babesia bovis T2Bo]|eukprot:XP_001609079.1 ethanolamine-phosphate cytidylyltransferase [Babesia bovis T2Bo]
MEDQDMTSHRRIYVDGVFDLVHWGHLNALRQAHQLGGKIVVGVVSDKETQDTKGIAPIYNSQERAELISGCRWVDDVIVDTPYDVTIKFLKDVAKCDVVAHGDDVAIGASGKDCYEEIKNAGLFVSVRRSRGCSTSTTLGRLVEALSSDRFSHFASNSGIAQDPIAQFETLVAQNEEQMSRDLLSDDGFNEIEKKASKNEMHVRFPRCRTRASLFSKFIPMSCKPDGAKVIYVDGTFDVFHVGHLRFLQRAKELGDYLIVGLYDDQTVRTIKGNPFPVNHLMDRALTVLAMKYVDDVIMGAPFIPSKNYLENLEVSLVAVGNHSDDPLMIDDFDNYAVARDIGILKHIDSGCTLTSSDIIQRVSNRLDQITLNVERRCKIEQALYH